VGSLAAIRRSLAVVKTPAIHTKKKGTAPPPPPPPPPPKSISEFYRVWAVAGATKQTKQAMTKE
jgi:hypothetical protein